MLQGEKQPHSRSPRPPMMHPVTGSRYALFLCSFYLFCVKCDRPSDLSYSPLAAFMCVCPVAHSSPTRPDKNVQVLREFRVHQADSPSFRSLEFLSTFNGRLPCFWSSHVPPRPPSLSLCVSFPLWTPRPPLFLLSSDAPSHRKPGFPENKRCSVERDRALGGGAGT